MEELSALVHHLQLYEFYLYGHAWGAVIVQGNKKQPLSHYSFHELKHCLLLLHAILPSSEFALATSTSTDAMLRGLLGVLLDSAFSDGELYSQTLWYTHSFSLHYFYLS